MAVEVRVRVWVQLLRGEEEAGSVSSLKLASRDLVDDLRDAVWEKNKAELGDVIPARLTVHRERGGKALREDEGVPTDTKRDTPLFVVAPQAPGAPPPSLPVVPVCASVGFVSFRDARAFRVRPPGASCLWFVVLLVLAFCCSFTLWCGLCLLFVHKTRFPFPRITSSVPSHVSALSLLFGLRGCLDAF